MPAMHLIGCKHIVRDTKWRLDHRGFLYVMLFSILHTLGLTKTQLALWVALWHKELRRASYSCVEYNNSGKHFEDLTIQYLNRCVWTTEWRVKHLGCMMQWRLFHKNTMPFKSNRSTNVEEVGGSIPSLSSKNVLSYCLTRLPNN